MDFELGRLNNFGIMYSGHEDPVPFEQAYRRVKDDPWGFLLSSRYHFQGKQLERWETSSQGARNLQVLEEAIRSRVPFFSGLPITISYHGSALYGSPVKNDIDYIITIDPDYKSRSIYADTCLLCTQIDYQLVHLGVQPDSIVIENRGISNSRFLTDDYIKLFTAIDISLFMLSVPIYGFDVYEEILQRYMELLSMDTELLVLTATIQEETLQYHLGRWGLSDKLVE